MRRAVLKRDASQSDARMLSSLIVCHAQPKRLNARVCVVAATVLGVDDGGEGFGFEFFPVGLVFGEEVTTRFVGRLVVEPTNPAQKRGIRLGYKSYVMFWVVELGLMTH